MLTVKCKQIVENEDLCDGDDREEMALGKDGVYDYTCPEGVTTPTEALDLFHNNVAIGCLDNYEFWVEDGNGNKVKEEDEYDFVNARIDEQPDGTFSVFNDDTGEAMGEGFLSGEKAEQSALDHDCAIVRTDHKTLYGVNHSCPDCKKTK